MGSTYAHPVVILGWSECLRSYVLVWYNTNSIICHVDMAKVGEVCLSINISMFQGF